MSRLSFALSFILALPFPVHAQLDYAITTIAGNSYVFRGDGKPATDAQLSQMYDLLCDFDGSVLVADRTNHQVVRIGTDGILRVVAGNGIEGFSGDGGPATRASLSFPTALALDAFGNLYIGDRGNYRVRRVDVHGNIETVAGSGLIGTSGDGGPALSAQFMQITGLAADGSGSLYVSDASANRIRRISASGMITNFAGTGVGGYGGDGGPAVQAKLNEPERILLDGQGNLLIADSLNHRVRSVSPAGVINTIVGRGTAISDGDGGPALQAGLVGPTGIYIDSKGSLYVTDYVNRVRVVTAGMITTFAGSAEPGFGGDGGPATQAQLDLPTAVTGDRMGNIYIADAVNVRVRRVDPNGTIHTVGGNGQFRFSGDGGPAVAATFAAPFGQAIDADGSIYISDSENHRVRRIGTDGIITTYAGTGEAGFSGDGGPAAQAKLNYPIGLSVDGNGNLYIADDVNRRIRKVTPAGIISTVVGGGNSVPPVDGMPALQAAIGPVSVAADFDGNLFILDSTLCAILRVSTDGTLRRYAGKYLQCGSAGDGGRALDATIQTLGAHVGGIALGPDGSLYLAEPDPPDNAGPNAGGRVRRITPDGQIEAFAGNGTFGAAVDFAQAVESNMAEPESVVVDSFGTVYIGDLIFIYAVVDGQIVRLAGDLNAQGSGDGGSARNASFLGPRALSFDPVGNLVFPDSFNYRIRQILVLPPPASASADHLAFTAESDGAVTPPQTLDVAASIPGVGFDIEADPPVEWLRVSPAVGMTPRIVEITADPAGLAPGNYNTVLHIFTPLADPNERTVQVNLNVPPATAPRLETDKDSLSFTFPREAQTRMQTIMAINAGGSVLNLTIETNTVDGGSWLSASPGSGTARAGAPLILQVTANPAGLAAGTYTGSVLLHASTSTVTVPVTMTVSEGDRAILLSQSGVTFTGVSGGGFLPVQKVEVLNIGRGVVNWTVSTSTLSGGNGWLVATPGSGSSDAGTNDPSTIEVGVRQADLAPGVYYGLVRVDAPDAVNSPQVLTVFLQVLPSTSDPGAVIEPAELIFTGVAGRSPGSQDVFVYNVAKAAKTYRSTAQLDGAELVNLPGDATLDPAQPNRVIVQPFVDFLPPGVHTGTLNLQFTDGRVRSVRVRVILTSDGVITAGRAAAGCTPTKLVPAMTSISQSAPVTGGWPVPMNAEVRDDCGDPLEQGAVIVSFSNGDTPVALTSLRNGRWSGTWSARASGTQASTTLKVEAVDTQRAIRGEESIVVGIATQQTPPVIEAAGVVSAAGSESYVPLAPGSIISVYGERLADSVESATAFPLPTEMGAARLVMGGRELPLLYVSPNQINAIVPVDLPVNTRHQLLIRRGTTYGRPVALDVAASQPAVFLADAGTRLGHVYWVRTGGQAPMLASAANPAKAGDVLVVYADGLGRTQPAVGDGMPAPLTTLSNVVAEVKATIGGVPAQIQFAGLAPGFAGLYQLNILVPNGVPTGNAVELELQVSGQTSPLATLAIQ